MSWLSDRLGIRINSRSIPNLLKNIAPAAAFIPGIGPLASAGIAAGVSGLGSAISPGSNIGDIIGSAGRGAAMSQLAGGAKRALAGLVDDGAAEYGTSLYEGGMFGGGGAGDAGAAGSGAALDDLTSQTAPDVSMIGENNVPPLKPLTPPAPKRPGFFSNDGFLGRHSKGIEMGLKGLGTVMSAPAENARNRSEARLLDVRVQQEQDEMERRRRLEQSLEPIRIMLAQQLNAPRTPVTPNPYAGS